jgi:plastocyanin
MISKTVLLSAALSVAALDVAALDVAAPQAPSADAVGSAAIQIDNFAYSPPTLVVAPGTTVTWTNDDDDVHTVVEKDRKFKSAALDTGGTFSQTFPAAGEYEYFCSLHPRMVGKVVVKPAGQSS